MKMTNGLNGFLQGKINDCERVFEDANTNGDQIFMEGMLKYGGQGTALIMCIGKRQAYIEVLDYLRECKG